jgi:hypothetical protein
VSRRLPRHEYRRFAFLFGVGWSRDVFVCCCFSPS